MPFAENRRLNYQNPTSGRLYDVSFYLNPNGSAIFKAQRLGINRMFSDPQYDGTEVTGVVLATQIGKLFGMTQFTDTFGPWTESAISQGAWFDASNPAAAGAALSTILT